MRVLILGVNGFIGNALTERILQYDRLARLGPRHRLGQDRALPRQSALHVPRGRHRDQQGVDRVPGQEVRRRAAARRDRDARGLRAASRWRSSSSTSRRTSASSSRPCATASAWSSRRPPRSTGCAPTPSSTRIPRPSSTARSRSSAGSTRARKQLLDRVIWAYGTKGLQFTLFRPFNWFGPHLDDIDSPKEGSSRVLTQFLHNILYGEPIKLVDGGTQRRSFTYISDGIDALMSDPREPRRGGRRRHLQHRQPRQRPLDPRARRCA